MALPFRTVDDLPPGSSLTVRCGSCGHSSELAGQGLVGVLGRRPLLELLGRFACRACGRRSASVDLVIPLRHPKVPTEPGWQQRMRRGK